MRTRISRRFPYIGKKRSGQTAVEYLLTTLVLTMAFAGMYGFMQKQLSGLYKQAAKAILTSYGHQ